MSKLTLNKRERTVVLGGLAALVLILLYTMVPGPVQQYRRSVQAAAEAQSWLKTARMWHDEVVSARARYAALLELARTGNGGGDLYAAVNRAVQALKLQDRANLNTVSGTTPSVAQVQLNLKGVSLREVVDLMHAIYSGNTLVLLQDLRTLGPGTEGKGLDCQMTLMAPRV